MERRIVVFGSAEKRIYAYFRVEFFPDFAFQGIFAAFARFHFPAGKFPHVPEFAISSLGGEDPALVADDGSHYMNQFHILSIGLYPNLRFFINIFADKPIFLFLPMRDRITEEKEVVGLMIRMYCRHKEHNRELCGGCAGLLDYALLKLDRCRFADNKPTCRNCPAHCYRKDMRERIRTVMRWAGPRMLLYHPVYAVRHLLREAGSRNPGK